MAKSKPFAIATEGLTVDGRTISREEIQQMAAHYDPKAFTANANIEHLLSYSPDSIFSAQGPVIALSTQEVELFGEKKLQLMGVVDVNDAIVAMQKVGKKAFASIEITKNFLNKGFSYLTGLAFTDTPASIGTESMKFSAGKQNVYSFSHEVEVIFEAEIVQDKSGENLFSKVMGLLNRKDKSDETRFSDIGNAVEAIAVSQKEVLEKFTAGTGSEKTITGLREELAALTQKDAARETAFAALKSEVEKLSAQPNGKEKRPSATGGTGTTETDC